MSTLQPLAELLVELLREDPRRLLLGEDVETGGILGLSALAAQDPELSERVLGSPLTCAALLAHAGGLALSGARPIVLLSSASALLEGFATMRELGRLPWRSAGALQLPLLFVAPEGPGFGLGGDAGEAVESTLAQLAGVELLSAGRSAELCAFMRSAAQFSELLGDEGGPKVGPRVLLLPRSVAVQEFHGSVDLQRGLERAPTATLREGQAATLFAWGGALEPALAAAEACAADEAAPIHVEVVDVARLAPLDEQLLIERANATGKIVIAHCGGPRHGIGAELAALFAEHSILHLDAPILRVCGESPPLRASHEQRQRPSAAAIAAAITQVVHY